MSIVFTNYYELDLEFPTLNPTIYYQLVRTLLSTKINDIKLVSDFFFQKFPSYISYIKHTSL